MKIIKFPERSNESLKSLQLSLFQEPNKEESELLKKISRFKKSIRNWQIKQHELQDLKIQLLEALEEIKFTGTILSFEDIKVRHNLKQDLKYVNYWINESYLLIEGMTNWLVFNKYRVN